MSFAEDSVEVTLPGFDVTLNGTVVDNRNELYPFIQYKGITYLPMTWDMSYALGLELNWSDIKGLEIKKKTTMKPYVTASKTQNVTGKSFAAEIVTFPVNVNGVQINNLTQDYPLISFRDITYFPMTYTYMVDEFNAGYKWDAEKGLSLKADPTLDIFLPEPYSIEYDFEPKRILAGEILSKEMTYLERAGDDITLKVNFNTHPEFDGYIIDVHFEYLDDIGNLIGTGYRTSRAVYEGLEGYIYSGYTKGIEVKDYSSRIRIKVSFVPYEIALAKKEKEYPDVAVHYYDDKEISLEGLKNMGAYYIVGSYVGYVKENYPIELFPYDAIVCSTGSAIDETANRYSISSTKDGVISKVLMSEFYLPLSSLTKLYVDPTKDLKQLVAKHNDVVIQNTIAHGIRLYDKDKKIFKILIQNTRVDGLYNK